MCDFHNPKLLAEANEFLRRKAPVILWHNHELEEPVWAVVVDEGKRLDECFWLTAFPTKEEAVIFCRKAGVPIVKEVDDLPEE